MSPVEQLEADIAEKDAQLEQIKVKVAIKTKILW